MRINPLYRAVPSAFLRFTMLPILYHALFLVLWYEYGTTQQQVNARKNTHEHAATRKTTTLYTIHSKALTLND